MREDDEEFLTATNAMKKKNPQHRGNLKGFYHHHHQRAEGVRRWLSAEAIFYFFLISRFAILYRQKTLKCFSQIEEESTSGDFDDELI